MFYAHARGRPLSPFPCLDSQGKEALYSNGKWIFGSGACTGMTDNPAFRIPSGKLGIAQTPGGKVLVSTGLWDKTNMVGTDQLIAITTLHELGHAGGLWHGGPRTGMEIGDEAE